MISSYGGRNATEVLDNACAIVQRCQDWHITLNPKKIEVGRSVKFAGYLVTDRGTEIHPDRVKAIKEFASPVDRT